MSDLDRRQSARIPFEVPVLVTTPRGPVAATIKDLSRTGLRFRIGAAGLGFQPSPYLAQAARSIRRALGSRFTVGIHYEVLGPLIRRAAALSRIALPADTPQAIDIGCIFDAPLSVEETTMLGVALPLESEDEQMWVPRADDTGPIVRTTPPSEAEAEAAAATANPVTEALDALVEQGVPPELVDPPAPVPVERTERPSRRGPGGPGGPAHRPRGRWLQPGAQPYRAYIYPNLGLVDGPLVCETSGLDAQQIVLWCRPDANELLLGGRHVDIAQAAIRFSELYGDRVNLKITRGADDIWAGMARVSGIEINPHDQTAMLLTLDFDGGLAPAVQASLGLV